MEYSKNDKTVNNFNLNKTIKLVASIITFFVGIVSCEISRQSLEYVKKIEKKYYPVEISNIDLHANKMLVDIEEKDDLRLAHFNEINKMNSPDFYKYLENIWVDVEKVNTYFLLDQNYEYHVYVLDNSEYDLFNPKLEENSGEIKKKYAITVNNQKSGNNRFSIVKIPSEKSLVILDLVWGDHILVTEGNLSYKNKTSILNKNKNLLSILTNANPNIKLIHMIYEDHNKNKEIITYVLNDCNCFQIEGNASTDIKTFMFIAINSTELNNSSFLSQLYYNLNYKVKDNHAFKGENLGNHRILITDSQLMVEKDFKIWGKEDLKSFMEFQNKLINERKEIIKYLEEIGE